ncbi:hypothetical protein HCJ93_27260 [Streptomyces sp. SBST2-5]|uniref:Protein-arginine deiminase C-terminal domain-containing protein n=1 Tax=Streptomyces composti TaxID=2720025 RepID=A0ABX1ABB1_9ACTN|nr:hypothetical protein [Streptomyces composti]
MRAAHRRAGLKVSYVDDWHTCHLHLGMGEVHCGTSTLREAGAAWWRRRQRSRPAQAPRVAGRGFPATGFRTRGRRTAGCAAPARPSRCP